MELIGIFIDFVNNILGFHILGLPIYNYLITFTAIEIVIWIIHSIKDN